MCKKPFAALLALLAASTVYAEELKLYVENRTYLDLLLVKENGEQVIVPPHGTIWETFTKGTVVKNVSPKDPTITLCKWTIDYRRPYKILGLTFNFTKGYPYQSCETMIQK